MSDALNDSPPGGKFRRNWHLFLRGGIVLAVVAAAAIFVVYDIEGWFTFEAIKNAREALVIRYTNEPAASMAVFLLAYVALTTMCLPVAGAMMLIAGAVFGWAVGGALCLIAAASSAVFTFIGARYVLRSWMTKLFATELERVDTALHRYGAAYLISARIVPGIPFAVLNIVAGVSSMRLRTYLGSSLTGLSVPAVLFSYVGAQVARINSFSDVLTPGVWGAVMAAGLTPVLAKHVWERFSSRSVSR